MLHVGAMKTGTTYLQQLIADNRGLLRDEGFAVPRRQAVALRSLLAAGGGARAGEHAERLVQQVRESADDTTVLVSWEFLSFADRDSGRRLLTSLGTDDVRVVLTVRDAARTLPAQWQTTTRNGGTLTWPRFTRGVGTWLDTGRATRPSRLFERTQGVARMLDVWTGLVGPERVHVVTVPVTGRDPSVLWRRFAEAVGADPALPVDHEVRRNPSLGYPSAELLRRVNEELGASGWPRGASDVIRSVVAPDLEQRAQEERPIVLDPRGREVAAAWNARVREAIVTTGVAVTGDLADLPDEPPAVTRRLEPPSDTELLAAAATARSGLEELGARTSYSRGGPPSAAVADLAAMVRQSAGSDLREARRRRGRGRR